LTVIHGYLETLVDSDDHGLQPWRQIVNQMQQQSSRMQRIVEDLLLLSRLESKQQTEHREMIDVAALLTAIKEEAEGLSGNQNHVIALRIEPGLRIEGSASELDSAFSNLVFNAVRYTPAGGEIKLRWWQDEDGPCFSVTDTGIGIQAEHIPRLTERFYRVDVGRSRKSGGTGLGLAIVKHVLIRHNARLEIESEPGKGSTFSCRFPVALAPEAVAKAS
jgi:two-component system phosphate regulon sensor histidine kinase PhoR